MDDPSVNAVKLVLATNTVTSVRDLVSNNNDDVGGGAGGLDSTPPSTYGLHPQ